MNISSFLPDQNQMRTPLSDEELRRLAAMLQDKGEGLAAINPQEAQMLKDAGGSGKPLPGTMGLGVGGGPIRSYQYGKYAGGDAPSKPDQGAFETRPEVIVARESTSSDSDNNNQPPPPPPKPTYGPDDDGGMHFTKAELDAANSRSPKRS